MAIGKDEKENLKSEINTLKGMLESKVAAAHRGRVDDLDSRLYAIFSRSKDRQSLDLSLYYQNFSCNPVYHSNGGVDDLKIIHKGEKFYASELFTPGLLVSILNKWEYFTGQRPAYKIAALKEVKERMLQAQQQRESKGFKMKM